MTGIARKFSDAQQSPRPSELQKLACRIHTAHKVPEALTERSFCSALLQGTKQEFIMRYPVMVWEHPRPLLEKQFKAAPPVSDIIPTVF